MIYIVYFFVLILLLRIELSLNGIPKYVTRVFISLLYASLIGFRGESVGVDTQNYIESYIKFGAEGCPWMEPGFDLINTTCYKASLGFQWMFFSVSLLSCFFIYLSLLGYNGKKYTISALCFHLFTFFPFVNIVRQMVAICIFIFSFKYIRERKMVLYLTCILFATSFHVTAILLLPLYLLSNHKLPNVAIVLIYISSFAFLFFDSSQFLPSLDLIGKSFESYVEKAEMKDFGIMGYLAETSIYVIVLVTMLKNNLFKSYPLLSNFVFLAMVLNNLGIHVPIILRIATYFKFFVYMMYPILFLNCKKYIVSRSFTVIALLFIEFSIWINGTFLSSSIYPYTFYWEKIIP